MRGRAAQVPARRFKLPGVGTFASRPIDPFNGGSSTRAWGQISCRSPHDLHGPHSSHLNTKTSRDWLGIEMDGQIGRLRNPAPSYLDRYLLFITIFAPLDVL
jgi:hypothetical protein